MLVHRLRRWSNCNPALWLPQLSAYFHPLEVVGRGSDAQLQVGENSKLFNSALSELTTEDQLVLSHSFEAGTADLISIIGWINQKYISLNN